MRGKIAILCVLALGLLTGCGKEELKQIVADTTYSYSQMYADTWLNLLGEAQTDTIYEFPNGIKYYKVKDGLITLKEVKTQTEEICTEEFAKEEFYERLLESDAPLLFDDNGELYVCEAEMPGLCIGEIKKVEIIEDDEEYIHAEILGEDFILGEVYTDIVIVKENEVWKIDSLKSDIKE